MALTETAMATAASEVNRNPSFDLRWLKPAKDISLPLIVRGDFGPRSFGGRYTPPERAEDDSYSSPLPLDRGIIAVNCNRLARINGRHVEEADTIAHEFRHHEQFLRGYNFRATWTPNNLDWGYGEEYDRNIRLYIRRNPTEQDAMRYAYRFVGARTALYGHLFDHLKMQPSDLKVLW